METGASVSVADTRGRAHGQRYGHGSESQPPSGQRRFVLSAGHPQMSPYTPSARGSEVPFAYPRVMLTQPPRHCQEGHGTSHSRGAVQAVMSPFGLRVSKRARLDRERSSQPQQADDPSDFACSMPRQLFRSSSHEGGSYSGSRNTPCDWEELSHSTHGSAPERSFVHSHRTSPFQVPSPLPTDEQFSPHKDQFQQPSSLSHFHDVNYVDVRREDANARGTPKATPLSGRATGGFFSLERSPDSVSSHHIHCPNSNGHFSPSRRSSNHQVWESSPPVSRPEVPVHPEYHHGHYMANAGYEYGHAHFAGTAPPNHQTHYHRGTGHNVARGTHYAGAMVQQHPPIVRAFSNDSSRMTGSTFRSSSFDRSEYLACSLGKEEIATVIRRKAAPHGGIEKFRQRNRRNSHEATHGESQSFRDAGTRGPSGTGESSQPPSENDYVTPPTKLRFFNEEVEVDIKGVALTDKTQIVESSEQPLDRNVEGRDASSSFKLATPKRKPASGGVVESLSRKRGECPSSAPPGASGDECSVTNSRRLRFRRVLPQVGISKGSGAYKTFSLTHEAGSGKSRGSAEETSMEVVKDDSSEGETARGDSDSPSVDKPSARTKNSTSQSGRQHADLLEEVFGSDDTSRGKSTDEDDGTVATEPASVVSESNDSNETPVTKKSASREGDKTLSAAKTLLCFMDAMSCGH